MENIVFYNCGHVWISNLDLNEYNPILIGIYTIFRSSILNEMSTISFQIEFTLYLTTTSHLK